MFLKTYACFEDIRWHLHDAQFSTIWVYINNKTLQKKTLLTGDRLGKFK